MRLFLDAREGEFTRLDTAVDVSTQDIADVVNGHRGEEGFEAAAKALLQSRRNEIAGGLEAYGVRNFDPEKFRIMAGTEVAEAIRSTLA